MGFSLFGPGSWLLTLRSGLMASHSSVRPDGFRLREMERETHIVKLRGQGEQGQEGVEPSWRESWSIGSLLVAMGLFREVWGYS